jgi:hypothetical protein
LSIIKFQPNLSVILIVNSLAVTSTTPPGANGTITRIGLLGKSCEKAELKKHKKRKTGKIFLKIYLAI